MNDQQGNEQPGLLKEQFFVRSLNDNDVEQLVSLFSIITHEPGPRRFHPHPFTAEYAAKIATYSGKDSYFGFFLNSVLVGYGMLRGWDEGYKVPSLGIYLSPKVRGHGLSKIAMQVLHDCARKAGADKIMLKVYPSNAVAVKLYQSLGYLFGSEENGQWTGFIDLTMSRER